MRKYDIGSTELDEFVFGISYYFSDEMRNIVHKPYGSYGSNAKFSALYEKLVQEYNGGEYFIQTYFELVYPEGIGPYVEAELDKILQDKKEAARGIEGAFEITSDMLTSKGLLDRRFKVVKDFLASGLSEELLLEAMQNITKKGTFNKWYKAAKQFYTAADEASSKVYMIMDEELEPLTELVKEDLLQAFELGLVPLNHTLSDKTIQRRKYAGIESESLFFATGQLLNDVTIVFEVHHNG